MRLSPKIYEHLVCPDCRTRLVETERGIWSCANGHNFREANGVLFLRPDLDLHPVSPEGGDGSIEVEELLASGGILGFLKKVIGTNYVPYGFNPQELIQPDDLVLNLGSGVADGKSPSTVNLDYFLFPFVDVVADAHNIPFEDSFFDVVLSEFMIEHVKDPSRVCSEISRVLKPGGTLYVSYPFIHPYHSFPNDYFRFTHSGLQAIFAGMEVIREGPLTGPACRWIGATADIFTFWIKVAKVRIAMRALILALLSPMKFLDLAFNRLPESKCHAVTLFSILRKKGTD